LSQGRSPEAPKLTPEYLAKWNVIRESRIGGSYEYDNTANCLPPGMPAMMSMAYGMEIMQDDQKITFFSEHLDALRRVYLDGRKPSQRVLNDPTYAGYSTGRWEGDTLVVDTAALLPGTLFNNGVDYTENVHLREQFRLADANTLIVTQQFEDSGSFEGTAARIMSFRRGDDHVYPYDCDPTYGIAIDSRTGPDER
jgi:hypothetical protein